METTHYSILSLETNASLEEIRKSYRRLAKECHPDKGGNKDLFVLINTAYEVLSEPAAKAAYDNSLSLTNEPTVEYSPNSYTDQIATIINGIHHSRQITKALEKIIPILNNLKLSNDRYSYIAFSSNVGTQLMNIIINDLNNIDKYSNRDGDRQQTHLEDARSKIILIEKNIDFDNDTYAVCIKYITDIDNHLKDKRNMGTSEIWGAFIAVIAFVIIYSYVYISSFGEITVGGIVSLIFFSYFIYFLSKFIICVILRLFR